MKNYFSLSRIQLTQIFNDTYQFIKDKYKQADKVFSEASPWGQLLSVINRLFGMNMYYIEDSIGELNINTATRPGSIYGLSVLAGHQPTRAQSATGLLAISYNNKDFDIPTDSIIIPNFLKMKCVSNNLSYIGVFPQEELVISLEEARTRYYTFKIFQGTIQSQTFTGTGNALQSFECNMSEGDWIDQYFVNVYVNGQKFKKLDSLYDMPFQDKCVMVKTGITSGIDIIFGNGSFGYIPELGEEIYVEYLVTEGNFGNINKANNITFNFEDVGYDKNGNIIDLNQYFNIAMETNISLGTFPESTDLTKKLAPNTSRSMVLAQTSNYEVFFAKMQLFSYIKAYTDFDIYDPYIDNVIYLFLIPDIKNRITSSSNYFNISIESFKLSDYEKFNLYKLIEESNQKIFGTIPYFIDPVFVKYGMNIFIKMWSNYDERDIKQLIYDKLSNYLLEFKRIDYVPKSDIIAILESINGVDSVALQFFDEKTEKFLGYLFDNIQWQKCELDKTLYDFNFNDKERILLQYFYADKITKEYYDKYNDKSETNQYLSELDPDLWDEFYNVNFSSIPNYLSCNKIQISNFLMSLDSVKTFINKNYDQYGNIILNKNEYPIFRGNYLDRNGNLIYDTIDNDNRLQSINVYFEKIDNTQSFPSAKNNSI